MKRWLTVLLNILSLLLFGLILWWGGPSAWQPILNSDPRWVVVAFLLYGVTGMLSGLRLKLVGEGLAERPLASWRRFYYVNMTARALGLILPRGLSTVGGKAVGLRAFGVSTTRSVWSVLVDNLFDILFLGLLIIPIIFYFQSVMSGMMLMVASLVIVLISLPLLRWGVLTRWLEPILNRLRRFRWIANRIQWDEGITVFPPPVAAVNSYLTTVALSLTIVATYYFIGQAVQIPLAWGLVWATFAITQLSLIVAVAPGGLGIFDLGWLGLLYLGGISEADGLAFVIAQRAFIYIFVLFWAGFSAILSLTVREKSQPPAPPET